MIEIRKDYILNRWSYIAADRGKRVKQFDKIETNHKDSVCFFCVGNEQLTPPEIGRIGNKSSWKVRWFPNKFPAVDENSIQETMTSEKYYTSGGAFGYHEVIAETPDHERQFSDLNENEIKDVLLAYTERMKDLSKRDKIKYVQIFKNSGAEAGTSIIHTHTQIVATTIVPRLVQEEVDALKKYKKCPYCDIIKSEEKSNRLIFSDENFIVFAPYAPRYNYEAWIFPKKHYKNITELNNAELDSLAKSFKIVVSKLGIMNFPYNFYLHYSPKGKDLHFHFEITPRTNKWAGFELATESYVIITSPEDAAKFYKE
ncbi:MAG: galactose-1-phosphate uridylyltransferase [Patescibacteria group bacterium]|nr:galactose-1-phosphate uridylyltransferase [Patescibacteria group bacterium]